MVAAKSLPSDAVATEVNSDTVAVASKLPFDFIAETSDGTKHTFFGGKAKDAFGEMLLTDGYGITTGVPADWFLKWSEEVGDFAPLKNGAIFIADTADKAKDAARERKAEVKTGLGQKKAEDLGVEVVPNDK